MLVFERVAALAVAVCMAVSLLPVSADPNEGLSLSMSNAAVQYIVEQAIPVIEGDVRKMMIPSITGDVSCHPTLVNEDSLASHSMKEGVGFFSPYLVSVA